MSFDLQQMIWDRLKPQLERVWQEDDVNYEGKERWEQAWLRFFPDLPIPDQLKKDYVIYLDFGDCFLYVYEFLDGMKVAIQHSYEGSSLFRVHEKKCLSCDGEGEYDLERGHTTIECVECNGRGWTSPKEAPE